MGARCGVCEGGVDGYGWCAAATLGSLDMEGKNVIHPLKVRAYCVRVLKRVNRSAKKVDYNI